MKPNLRFLLLGAILVVALGLLLLSMQTQEISNEELESLGVVVLPEPIPMNYQGLVNEDGVAFDGTDITGKWTFAFFGYTHCPDLCPVTLAQLKTVFDHLKENGEVETVRNLQRMFVSIDAKRDNHESVKSYTDNIDAEIIGVTGDPDSIKRFAQSVFVGYKKLGEPTAETDYLVDHQGNIVIFDRNGDCYGFIKSPFEDHLLARIFRDMAQLG